MRKVNVTAKIVKITTDKTMTKRIVLDGVVVDGRPFRDHAWIKWSKRFKNVKCGDTITATAEVREYLGGDLKPKLGLGHFRNVVVVGSV